MSKHLLLTLVCVAVLSSGCCYADSEMLPGHMQPLGSHMEPELIRRLDHVPSPAEFYEEFVRPKIPVVFEGVMADQEVIKNWQSDQYLRSYYGDDVMGIEAGKKENRSEGAFTLTMKEFIDQYKTKDMYMVSDLSEAMTKDWSLPKFMLCGGFTQHLMFLYIWFSSGGTKSVVHTDSYENLHCLVSGQKKFVMIEPQYTEEIGPEHAIQGFFNIDVERVNMTAYPHLAKIPWHLAEVHPGDCLYLPYLWVHNVNSEGRNMGVNVWWSPFKFQPEDCPDDMSQLPNFSSLENMDLAPELQLTEVLTMVERENGVVYAEDMYELMSNQLQADTMRIDDIMEMFDILQPGCDGVIEDTDQIPRANMREAFQFVTDLAEQMHREEMERNSGFNEQGQPLHDDEYHQDVEEFGGEDEMLDEEDLWAGPISDRMREGGGDYQDTDTKRDEL